MQRRTLLQWLAAASAAVPFNRVRLWAQPRELTPESMAVLRDVASTVLPASIGAERANATVERFIAWTRGYREGVPTAHGYGHPRLQKTGPSPVPLYVAQLTGLDAAARALGAAKFSALDLEARRTILDTSIAATAVRTLPPRPAGQHVAVDLMAFYFRSSEANDDCYRALIQREVCRPIEITVRRPAPKA